MLIKFLLSIFLAESWDVSAGLLEHIIHRVESIARAFIYWLTLNNGIRVGQVVCVKNRVVYNVPKFVGVKGITYRRFSSR